LTSTGAMISIMTLLATVEASGVCFIRCCIWSGWGFLSTLIPSIRSLKEVGTWNFGRAVGEHWGYAAKILSGSEPHMSS
jgi:hypothetical protein